MPHVILTSLFILLLFQVQAFAVMGPQGVGKTAHNLSTQDGGTLDFYVSDNEDEICIFCHTPHGGSLDGPLWNRSSPSNSTFTHYSTTTLDSISAGASRLLSDESLICMSCHDGAMAINHILNPSNRTGTQPTIGGSNDVQIVTIPGVIGGVIGKSLADESSSTDLTDDHPISFKYDDVLGYYASAGKGSQLHDVTTAIGSGVRFYGANNRVECGSCHDPHVNYDSGIPDGNDPTADEAYRPFLITPNDGSKLCLACHNK
ncbi:MAG TPA: hypothetical protein ENN94_04405 [Geoalkalibacter subterraneus]|uniref:Doubled CXXCH motif domain-containing protein n=1 Tax=Geoalkalibacter subterraneus TaxID=483547 RepID=A0A831PIR1_9BACT|nr:hypothetical protein [Geoalkalibacter subterraneus]